MTEPDWRMKAMADFFGAKFVRVDEDGEPMTTNNDAAETHREALIAGISKRIDTFCEHVGYGDPDVTREEAESYVAEIEEALLADRAVPTVQAAAGDAEWLDAALDSVHPKAAVHVWLEAEPEPEAGLPHHFMARLDVNGPNTSAPHYGDGTTRRAAIEAAITAARTQKEHMR